MKAPVCRFEVPGKNGGKQMHSFDVLVIGRSCLDMIAVLDRFPEENRKAPISFRLQEGGGQGGTAACCISRLGGRPIYVGRLGDDPEGKYCLQRLLDFGVETGHVDIVQGGRTPVAYIFVTRSTGARTILYEINRLPPITPDAALENLLSNAGVLLLDPETTALAKDLRHRKHDDLTIVYDCERWREGLPEMMMLADYFIPSSDFFDTWQAPEDGHSLPERMMRLKEQIHGDLIVTDGEDGACFMEKKNIFHVAAPEVKAVDTIGAGDNFHAAFALAIARGMSLRKAVKFSVATATLSCRDYGGRSAIPTWHQAQVVADHLKIVKIA